MIPPEAEEEEVPLVTDSGHPWPDTARDLRAQAARNDMAERRRITQKLRAALTDDGFVLYYQPKLHLKSGLMRGAEAVIRMLHRRRGLILPAHFMPVAERSDIVNDIGAWTLHHACRTAMTWPARFGVSLNVSHRQLRSGKLVKHVIEALSRTGLNPARLELELSEDIVIDDHQDTAFALKAVRALGVGIALDDFGAGYASLSALRRVPLTTLKLDRSVIVNLPTGDQDIALVRVAIDAAHALGMKVVADGVETSAQRLILDQMGCDEAQGSYFSPALSAAELLARITR